MLGHGNLVEPYWIGGHSGEDTLWSCRPPFSRETRNNLENVPAKDSDYSTIAEGLVHSTFLKKSNAQARSAIPALLIGKFSHAWRRTWLTERAWYWSRHSEDAEIELDVGVLIDLLTDGVLQSPPVPLPYR